VSDTPALIATVLPVGCLLGSLITWRIMQRRLKLAQYRASQIWLGQQKLWKQYQELLKERRTQP
jgi:membrane protein YqaA with SNARE-associated domain